MNRERALILKTWQWLVCAAAVVVFVVVALAGPWLAAARSTQASSTSDDIKEIVQELQDISHVNHQLQQATNKAVTAQIPGLQAQIARDKKTISDQTSELNQAVAAIERLAAQVTKLGGNPGEITIQPPS